jgi:hypothetical protein
MRSCDGRHRGVHVVQRCKKHFSPGHGARMEHPSDQSPPPAEDGGTIPLMRM